VYSTEPDQYQTGEYLAKALKEQWAQTAARNKQERRLGYRVPPAVMSLFREAMQKYAGTGFFHNFTPKKAPTDPR
jgi:hypothetical protein